MGLSVLMQTAKHTRDFSVYQHYGLLKYDAVEFRSNLLPQSSGYESQDFQPYHFQSP